MSSQKRNIIEVDDDNDIENYLNLDEYENIDDENDRNSDNNDKDNDNHSAFNVLLKSGGHGQDIKKGGSKPHSWVWKFGDRSLVEK